MAYEGQCGRKIHLFTLFEKSDDRWTTAASPVYGEKDVLIRYLCLDLLWRPIRRLGLPFTRNIRWRVTYLPARTLTT